MTALSAVVLACRDQGRGEKLKCLLEEQAKTSGNNKLSAEVMLLDVSSLQSVRSFAQAWNQRPLHGLINNAGIFDVGSSMHASSLYHQSACSRCPIANLDKPNAKLTHSSAFALLPRQKMLMHADCSKFGLQVMAMPRARMGSSFTWPPTTLAPFC